MARQTARLTLALLALSAVHTACSTTPVRPLLEEFHDVSSTARAEVRWPDAPEVMRIRYLGEIAARRDFDPRRSLWKRVMSVFTGLQEPAFVRPTALCLSGSTLVVADAGGGAVHFLDLVERRWLVVDRTPDAVFGSPVGVACFPDTQVAVADSTLERISVFDAAGAFVGPLLEGRLERPTGLAQDLTTGGLWVAETLAHQIRLFALDGRELLRTGARGSAPGQFNFPTYLASDGAGGVWVNDSLNFRVQHLGVSGEVLGSFGTSGDQVGSFARPRGLAVDTSGRIFSVDALLDRVQIFTPDGQLLLSFGGRGAGAGEMWLPSDVVLDGMGHVYVSDSYNQRIQVFAYYPPEGD